MMDTNEDALEEVHQAKIWSRGFRLEARGQQTLMVGNAERAALELNDARPATEVHTLSGWFGKTALLERLDIPSFGSTFLAFRSEVSAIVRPLLAPFGEFHECETELGNLVVFRCLNIVDALARDVETYVKPDGFGLTKEYRFDPARIPRREVFTLPHTKSSARVYYPDEFVTALDAANISYSTFALMFDEATGFYETAAW